MRWSRHEGSIPSPLMIADGMSMATSRPEKRQGWTEWPLDVITKGDGVAAAHALAHGRSWFRLVADSAPLGVFMTDPEGNCLYSNHVAATITGLTAEQLMGRGWMETIHPADRERVLVERARSRQRGVVFSCTHRFLHRGGKVIWASVKISEIRDGGKLLGHVGTLDDITERVEAEQGLRESEERWRSLAESTPDLICTIRPDGTFLYVNRVVVPDLKREDVIGTPVYRFVPPSDLARVRGVIEGVARTGQADSYQLMSLGAHGPRTWWETRVVPIRGGGGVSTLMLICWDITQRKKAEQERELYESIVRILGEAEDLNSALVAVLRKVCETTGWVLGQAWAPRADGVSLECSPAWYSGDPRMEAFHQASLEFRFTSGIGLPGRAWRSRQPVWVPDVGHDGNFPRAAPARAVGLRAGVAFPVLSGREMLAVIEFFLLERRDEDEGCISLVSSVAAQIGAIFQRKQAQEMLRGSHEQLRALSSHLQSVRERERAFIAREIHDELGQALTGLKMDVSWIEVRLADSAKPARRTVLLKRLRAMARLTDSLVQSVRRISSELRPGVLDELGMTAAIEWQAHEFRKRSGIRCDIRMPEEDLRVGRDASTAMFRIFQEILTNVARHANATRLAISLEEKDGTLLLRVRDDGRGITPEQVADPKSLGLLGIRERVLILGGIVEFKGTRGRGTAVTVRVPLDSMKPD